MNQYSNIHLYYLFKTLNKQLHEFIVCLKEVLLQDQQLYQCNFKLRSVISKQYVNNLASLAALDTQFSSFFIDLNFICQCNREKIK